jgi:hypothetical protein
MQRARWAVKLCFIAFLGIAPQALSQSAATAAPATPMTTTSWYMDTINSTVQDSIGCRQATAFNNMAGGQQGLAFLLYGSPAYFQLQDGSWRYGSTAYQALPYSAQQVADGMKHWVNGYMRCLQDYSSFMRIAMSVTNYKLNTNAVGYGHGVAWVTAAKTVRDMVDRNGWSPYIDIYVGGDLELEYNFPANTKGWVDGIGSGGMSMFNFGSSSGCPQTNVGDNCAAGGYVWSQADVHYINYGASVARSFPQQYIPASADQRYVLRLRHGTYYSGTLTEQAACQQRSCSYTTNTPAKGFAQLWDKLNSDSRTAQGITFTSDMKWCDTAKNIYGLCA